MTQPVIHSQQLVNSATPSIAGLIAGSTADRPIQLQQRRVGFEHCLLVAIRLIDFSTSGTQSAHQALRQHTEQTGGQQKGFHRHVGQACNRADRIVGVQGRQHQMPGQTRLHRNLRGFQVADFTYHDDVGVLAQNSAQGTRKTHVDTRINLRLADAVEIIFDWIFHRHDVGHGRIDARQRRVQRGGLARSGGPGDQHDAVWLAHQRIHRGERGAFHPQTCELQPSRILVQQTQHNAFTMPGRQGRDAHIDRFSCQSQSDAPILGNALFGDIQLRHNLDARHHRRMQGAVRFDHVLERPVHAEAHGRARLERLNMDIGRIFPYRLS